MSNSKRSSRTLQKRRWMIPVLFALALNIALIVGVRSDVFSQPSAAPVQEVRSIDLSRLGAEHPSSLFFRSAEQRFYTMDGTQFLSFDMLEDPGPTITAPFDSGQVAWSAFSESAGLLYAVDSSGRYLNAFRLGAEAKIAMQYDLEKAGLQPAGLAVGPESGQVYILDHTAPALVQLDLASPNETAPVRTALAALAGFDLAGLALDPATGLFSSYSPSEGILYTFNESGRILSRRDLAAQAFDGSIAFVFAPTGDSTDHPGATSLYVLDVNRVVEFRLDGAEELPARALLAPASLVQTIDTSIASWDPSSPDPAGVDYHPGLGRLVVGDSEVEEMPNYYQGKNVFLSSLTGTQTGNCDTTSFSSEPTGVAVNPITNEIMFSDDNADKVFFVDFGPDGNYCTGDDTVRSMDTRWFGSDDPEGVGYGGGLLFVSDGLDQEVYVIDPGPNGVFDGGPPGGDDSVTNFDTFSLGFNDPEGIDFSEDTGNVFIVNRNNDIMAEVTVNGNLVNSWDIAFLNAVSPAGLGLGPGSQDPGETTVYISQRGVDNGQDPNENDGKIFEVSIGLNTTPPTSTPSPTPTNTPDPNVTSTPIPPPTFTPTVDPNPQFLNVRVSASSDDAEEDQSGVVDLTSSDLELVYDGSRQIVGMRFNNITIPAGSTVTNAYVQFQVDESNWTGPVILQVQGQLSLNPGTFTSANANISSRERTTASVAWSPPEWTVIGQADIDQRTPDIKTVIQEVIGQPGWTSGNSIVIIVTGSNNNRRVAESFNGSSSAAPLLHITYSLSNPTATATFTPEPPTATPTDTATFTPVPPSPTPTATFTPEPPTATPTDTATFTPEPPTPTPTDTATFTPEPPSPTPTATFTPEPPTATPTDTATFTPEPPTPTPTATFTPEPPTATPTATFTPSATSTPLPPTATPTQRPNIALNRPVTASSQDPGFAPELAVDGNLTTAWHTAKATGNNRLNVEWLQVDLGAAYPVNQVVLTWDSEYATVYSIRVSTDGAAWSTVFLTSAGDGGQDVIDFNTTTARYIRLESSNWSNSVWRNWLFEFAVYGSTPVPSPTNTPSPSPTPTFTPTPTLPPTATPTPPPATGYHVADLEGTSQGLGNLWNASVSILVHDADHLPLAGAQVSGQWSINPSVIVTCITDAAGRCTIDSPAYPRNEKLVIFTVTNVTYPTGTYNPANNHDIDGDSDGNAIEVLRP